MENYDIIIIGAGAAGLNAARLLAITGKKVIVLEARDRCGGRIHTLHDQSFFKYAELGAEFIHGDLPVTLSLLNAAGINYHSAVAGMINHKDGKFKSDNGYGADWEVLMQKLNTLVDDTSIAAFLQQEFPGDRYAGLKDAVCKFVAGYDTADPDRASALALRKEWQNEDEEAQHRVEGGYGAMIKHLEGEITNLAGMIALNTAVTEIHWRQGEVKVSTVAGVDYPAQKVLIAVPLGVLQAGNNETGSIGFFPPVPDYSEAIADMGFGAIIKILLEFDTPFWEDQLPGGIGFIISDQEIPTWWTQYPQHSAVLTGWLGGQPALEKKNLSDKALIDCSLRSLANIFKKHPDDLEDILVASQVANWTTDPFTKGSYAYDTVAAPQSRKLLTSGIENTVFFAGEYLYDGPAMGTVEAALSSGEQAAAKIVSTY